MKKVKNPLERLEELRKELPRLTSAEIRKAKGIKKGLGLKRTSELT